MMTGKVVTTYSTGAVSTNNTSTENGTLISDASHQYSPVEVATAVTFTVAVIQVITLYLFCTSNALFTFFTKKMFTIKSVLPTLFFFSIKLS